MAGKTESALQTMISQKGALFAVLLDPDTSDQGALLRSGSMAAENGADLLLVGGSFMGNPQLPRQIAELKSKIQLPIVLFPGGASHVVPGFDAILFTTLISGRNPQYLIEEQVRGGVLVRAMGMEAIPTAYCLINSGRTTAVEFISNTRPIPSDKPKLTMVHAIAAELMGMRWIYLEAGSGAQEPVPVEHVAMVRQATGLTVITGGGLVSPEMAAARTQAGAHVVVTGTVWEKSGDAGLLKAFAQAVHRV